MTKQATPYPLRLEPETRSKLEALAHANGRSLNAQIALMLENALQGESVPESLMGESMREEVEQIARQVALEVFQELSKASD